MSLISIALLQVFPFAVVLSILYVAFIRPQQQKLRAYKQMLRDLRPGNQVVTEGGLYARIAELVDETDLILEFAPTLQFKAKKSAISEVVIKVPIDHADSAVDII